MAENHPVEKPIRLQRKVQDYRKRFDLAKLSDIMTATEPIYA